MSRLRWPDKHPSSTSDPFFVIWCDEDGRNDGTVRDDGELQGRTLSSITWTVPSGITKVSDNTNAVTIKDIDYLVNTVASIVLSGGTNGQTYEFTCLATFSDGSNHAVNILLKVTNETRQR